MLPLKYFPYIFDSSCNSLFETIKQLGRKEREKKKRLSHIVPLKSHVSFLFVCCFPIKASPRLVVLAFIPLVSYLLLPFSPLPPFSSRRYAGQAPRYPFSFTFFSPLSR